MKPASFRYHAPKTVEEALALLPHMRRMTAACWPADRAWCPPWRSGWPVRTISSTSTASRRCANWRWRRAGSRSAPVVAGPLGALLATVMRHIAHYPIGTRGTFCGSVAHADPASEWCLAAATLGAEMVARSARGMRIIAAADHFQGIMATALEPDELLAEVRLPLLAADTRFGFYEFNRRAGDFALGMALATFRLESGLIVEPRVGIGAAESHPRRIAEAEALLASRAPEDAIFRAAGAAAAAAIDPFIDAQTDAVYRRELVAVVTRRALEQAAGP